MSSLPKIVKNIQTIVGHNGAIYNVNYFLNHLFTSSADKFVAEWDLKSGKQTNFAVKLEKSAYSFAFSPHSQLLAIGVNNGDIHLIDFKEKKEVKNIAQHRESVFSLVYSAKNKQFYSGDRDGYFCVWDDFTFELLLTLPFDCGKIREIAISEDEKHIAICGQDGKVRVLETEFFNTAHDFVAHHDGVNCALFDGDFLYTGGKDAYIRKWNWKNGEKLLAIPGHNYAVYDMEFLQNKEQIVTVSFDKSIKIWKSNDLSILERIEHKNGGHRHTVNRIAKINENTFATVSDDRQIKIWEFVTLNG